jgi:hypothetical protein
MLALGQALREDARMLRLFRGQTFLLINRRARRVKSSRPHGWHAMSGQNDRLKRVDLADGDVLPSVAATHAVAPNHPRQNLSEGLYQADVQADVAERRVRWTPPYAGVKARMRASWRLETRVAARMGEIGLVTIIVPRAPSLRRVWNHGHDVPGAPPQASRLVIHCQKIPTPLAFTMASTFGAERARVARRAPLWRNAARRR